MSSVEIEDVLSSIRRLVSEDLRPTAQVLPPLPDSDRPESDRHGRDLHGTDRPARGPLPTDMAASKLILTPALRVVQSDVAAASDQSHPAQDRDADGWTDADMAAFVNVEDDALLDHDAEWRIGSDVVSLITPLPAYDGAALSGAGSVDAPQDRSDVPSVRDGVAEPNRFAQPPVLHADAAPSPQTEAADWQDNVTDDPERMDPDDLSDTGFVEAAHDGAQDGAYDAVWADAAEAEVLRQLAEDGPAAPAAASASAPGEDDMIYEENLLRELVRDIIREELQGALGERITRNVRKLVRAEIARAMALRDFE